MTGRILLNHTSAFIDDLDGFQSSTLTDPKTEDTYTRDINDGDGQSIQFSLRCTGVYFVSPEEKTHQAPSNRATSATGDAGPAPLA